MTNTLNITETTPENLNEHSEETEQTPTPSEENASPVAEEKDLEEITENEQEHSEENVPVVLSETAEVTETHTEPETMDMDTKVMLDMDEEEMLVDAPQEDEQDEEDSETSELDDVPAHRSKDYSNFSLEQLMAECANSVNFSPVESIRILQDIRPYFFELLRAERARLFQSHIESGGEADSFEDPNEAIKAQFSLLFKNAQEARAEERKRIEEEKLQNLKKKQQIIERLKQITDQDETLNSIEEVKNLQKEWKAIRIIPREQAQELWDTYIYFLDKFYDNHSINIELKNLDRTKNLEQKIALCLKVDELLEEENLKTAFVRLNHYREEFRNIGPVPKEFSQEIWDRFKATCDKVFEAKKAEYDELLEVRQQNAEKKNVLIEKAALIAEKSYKNIKDWKDKTDELNQLFEEWKQIGPVPRSQNDSLWKEFRKPFKQFYQSKSEYFEQRKKEQNANVLVKEDLCRQAEAIAELREDYAQATKELLNLQEAWKKSGPVPEKISNALWKRFREANDRFFEKKKQTFSSKIEEEAQNLEKKESIILRAEELLSMSESQNVFEELRNLQKEWSSVGNVPFKKKDSVNKRYNEVTDKLYEKYKKDRSQLKTAQAKDHYASLKEMPQGFNKLQEEEKKLVRKINGLKTEIETWNNNIGFFAQSKNAEKLRSEIEQKIEKTNEQINKLVSELRVLRGVMKEQQS